MMSSIPGSLRLVDPSNFLKTMAYDIRVILHLKDQAEFLDNSRRNEVGFCGNVYDGTFIHENCVQ